MGRRSMNWFEKLTGFRETSYDDTRAKLKVVGRQLQSLVNGKAMASENLKPCRSKHSARGWYPLGGLPGWLKVGLVTGDIRRMHKLPENVGALFQVASQFNLLEMTRPK